MVEVSCLKDLKAAELFLGFRIGAVGGGDFAVFPVQGHSGLRRLKRYFGNKMSVGAQMVVVLKAFVEHSLSLVLGHPFECSRLDVSQTDVFHCSSPLDSGPLASGREPAARLRAGSFISSLRGVFRGRGGQVVYLLPPGPCSAGPIRSALFAEGWAREPGRKEARAPRPPHRMRWHPCAPTPVPRPYRQLPVSKSRLCSPWSPDMARR